MLIYRFEEIKMLENETFGEFYTKINDLRNSVVSLGRKVSDAKLIKKILRSLPERFRIKVTSIEESKDLDSMKIEDLVGSLQTYEYSLPPVKKAKGMAFKTTKSKVSLEEDSDNEEELALIANRINKLMKTDKFIEGLRETPSEAELEKDSRGQRCCECSGFWHMRTECANLKQAKGKAYIATLCSESEKEEESHEKCLTHVAPRENQDDLYYSEHGDEELKEEYCVMYMELMKLRESNQKKVIKLNTMKTERDTLLQKITDLEELMDARLQFEKFSDNKIAQMLTSQKCSSDKTSLGYVATVSSNIAYTFRTVFLKPSGSEPQNDKGKAIMVSCENTTHAKSKHSTDRSSPTCHHYGKVGHIRPNCGQLKFPRTWNKKNAHKKEKDVEEHSKTKYVPPHRRQPTQKFVPIFHHCGLSDHIRPKCPHVC
jgi:hypothetical protein